MEWVKSSVTKSGYGIEVPAPADELETACLKFELIETDTSDTPDGETWTYLPEVIDPPETECIANDYVEEDYVEDEYNETGPAEPYYMDDDYVDEDYSDGGCIDNPPYTIHRWSRWVQDPVVDPYVRDGYLEEEINPVPCVPYTNPVDVLDDLHAVYPYGDVTAAVLVNDNLSDTLKSRLSREERVDMGNRILNPIEEK